MHTVLYTKTVILPGRTRMFLLLYFLFLFLFFPYLVVIQYGIIPTFPKNIKKKKFLFITLDKTLRINQNQVDVIFASWCLNLPNKGLIRKYKHLMKEIELSRKLKLKKKVNNSHYRGRQICAYFDIQQVLDTIIPMLERYFTVNCFLPTIL